ncbi:MAG: insulinase family protein [Acidobacteriota bacterium]
MPANPSSKSLTSRSRRLAAGLALLLILLTTLACSGLPVPEPQMRPGAFTPVVIEGSSPVAARAPEAPSKPAARAETIPFDPSVRRGTLDNGLRYYVRRNVKPESRAELRLVVNVGSLLEDEDQRGLAHFVEHMAFNGTENFEKQELVEYLERIGMRFGPDINAYTSFDETVYMLQIPTDDEQIVAQAFQILEDWAHRVDFEGEEIDKERGVVVEEWRLRRGAGGRIQDKQIPVLYHDSRYARRLPIGQVEVLENAPYDALRRFYEEWYRPDLMAVVAVGDFDEDDIERRIRDHFSKIENPDTPRDRETFDVPGHEETLFSIVQDPEATNISVTVGYKGERSGYETLGDMRNSLIENLYDGLLISRLGELSQKADPPFQYGFATNSSLGRNAAAYRLFAAVRDGGVERGLSTLLTEAKRVEQHGFTASELERAKTDVQRSIERSYEERDKQESGRFASQYVRHFLSGSAQPSIEFVKESMEKILPTVTLDEVNALAGKRITEENRVILVSGPETEAAGIPDEAALLDVFEQAQQVEVTPWVDQTRDAPLVPSVPTAGRVASTETIDELGVTIWTLSNGIKVQVKPTDFKNDEVLLRGTSPGGHSLVDNDDYITAAQASGIVGLMGLGEFSAIELDKALTGKVARAQAFIGALSEGVVGFASPKDLETMMQLVHLNFVAPRRDEEAFQSFLTRTRGFLENQQASPNYWYQKKWIEVANQNHPRRQMLTPEKLEEVELDEALDFYRERFADASDFLFTIVGNVDLAELQPLVETWLGSLPNMGRQEEGQDTGGYAPPEELSFTVEKGLEPKATVRLVFHGDAEWSPGANHVLGSMANVLRMRLREVLREDLGGVYGVGVGGNISIRPVQRYNVSISFGCDPERVDELIAAVRSEIERLQTEGPDQDDIDKTREIQRRGRETAVEQNRFWASVLESVAVNEQDPLDILKYDELVELVTLESVQEAAKKYMQRERSVLGVLLPEEAAEASAEG